jgi:glutamate synthase (NADPH/NADH) small chain
MEKRYLDRRLRQMKAEGTKFRPGVNVGVDITAEQLQAKYDAIVIAVGATAWRDLPIEGRDLAGVHQAMEFLPWGNKVCEGDLDEPPITAKGKHVVIIGGGDTGADCIGTSHREGALSVTSLEIMPQPPEARPANQPWPTYPMVMRTASAHEEGGERVYSVSTKRFVDDGNGNVRALVLSEVRFVDGKLEEVPGTEREIPADLVLLAMGFVGPEKGELLTGLKVEYDERGNVRRDDDYMSSVDGVFVAGDAGRGQSLIVWAIAEGRACAAAVDKFLTGSTNLPAPIPPTARPLVV